MPYTLILYSIETTKLLFHIHKTLLSNEVLFRALKNIVVILECNNLQIKTKDIKKESSGRTVVNESLDKGVGKKYIVRKFDVYTGITDFIFIDFLGAPFFFLL